MNSRLLLSCFLLLPWLPFSPAFAQGGISGALQKATQEHRVRSGDTLYGLAKRYGTSAAELRRLNGLRSDMIYPGQVLQVPGKKEGNREAGKSTTKSTKDAPKSHTVRSGDTLTDIAKRYGTTVAELQRLNGLRNGLIHPGQRLELPRKPAAKSPPSPPATTKKVLNKATTTPASVRRTAAPKPATNDYTVSPGDTLIGIAEREGTSVSRLKSLNGLRSDHLQVGQRLRVPKRVDTGEAARTAVQVDSNISRALAAQASGSDETALTLLREAVVGSEFKNAKARYFLAKQYDALFAKETDPNKAKDYNSSALQHYRGARDADPHAFAANSEYAGVAKKRLESRDPLDLVVKSGRNLQRGSQGPAVESLQRRLGLDVDGDFGPATESAIRSVQRDSGLSPTGRVDASTLKKLGSGAGLGRTSHADAWRHGRRLGPIQVVTIDGKPVERRTAQAFQRMRAAARADGVRLLIVSGFRSYAEQQHLYDLYLRGRGNLAARPGYSNHQDGVALDLDTWEPGAYTWLSRNARRFGFIRTVPSEDWHWEYRP